MVLFDGVAVRYGAGPEVLRGISFTLAPGSFHFLVGPSGAGKSSLLKLIYLGLRPAAGRVELFGRDVSVLKRSDYPAMRRRIGVVFQDFRLIDHLSAIDNVALPLRIAGVRESDIRRHVPELLAWVGLKHHLDALPATLSGGQQQRVAIARAVISRPSLLLADEPTGNVDDGIGVRLMYLFEELNKMGTTVVIATHNEGLVGRFTHRQLRIANGTVRLVDPAAAAAPEDVPQAASHARPRAAAQDYAAAQAAGPAEPGRSGRAPDESVSEERVSEERARNERAGDERVWEEPA